MIKNQKDYEKAMRAMIRRVQNGDPPVDKHASIEDMEILADCIKAGYINGTTTHFSAHSQKEEELRTLDGKMHPKVYNNVIPLKGLVFLNPQKDWKFIIPTVISLIALLKSFFPLLLPLFSK